MKSRSRYRLCVAGLLFSLVMHALAVGGTAVLLQPGMDAGASVLERATYVAGYVWLWRLGWLAWQLTALSDLLLSASLLAYLTATTSQERCGWAVFWAGLSLVATIVAVIPDQWAEASYVSSFVEAAQVVRGGGSQGEYVAVEARYLMMVGTCGNAGYTAMGFCWMLATAFAAGGVRRNWQFVLLGMITWCMFTAAGIANWRAATGASVSGFPGFDLVVWFNATAFPLLLVWMVMMAHVLGKGHHARHSRTDEPLHRLVWPTNGPASWISPLGNSAGLRDLMRASQVVAPAPVLASDITDVVYLNWLVPSERVAAMLPIPLQLDCFGQRTFVSILTYRHGHFGPRFFGPLRRLMPSPCQSNWRLYVEPEKPGAQRDAIYFFKTCLDNSLLVLGSRIMSDGLPALRPLCIEMQRDGEQYEFSVDPGHGSAPDLRSAITVADQRELPEFLREHFSNWQGAVKYLVEQNRAINVLPAQGGIRESRIDIPIAIESIQPAAVDFVESSYLASIIHGCEPFAFLVPRVKFLAVREGWTLRGISLP